MSKKRSVLSVEIERDFQRDQWEVTICYQIPNINGINKRIVKTFDTTQDAKAYIKDVVDFAVTLALRESVYWVFLGE